MTAGRALVLAAALTGAPADAAPLRLLDQADAAGAPVTSRLVRVRGDARRALTGSARWRVALGPRPLLTLGLGCVARAAPPPAGGRCRFSIRSERMSWERTLPAQDQAEWREESFALPDASREALVDVRVEAQGDVAAGLAEPVLHELGDYGRARGVLLISVDTLRRDRVGAYGYERPTTPVLDALAREAVLCDDAVSTSSWTLPAHLSMFTSLDQGRHGGVDRDHGWDRRAPTLAGLLRQAGFATHAVTSHLYVSPAYGLDDGFDTFLYRQDATADAVARRAAALLDEAGDRPFFLFLHFYDPHWPYGPPADMLALFERPGSYAGGVSGSYWDFARRPPGALTPADLAHLRALYDGEVRFTDGQVGAVLAHVRRRGLQGSTLVLVTSDHGEEFLEHGAFEHQRSLYEEVLRIPLLLRAPGVAPRREPAQVSLLDVAPTVLAWAGLPAPRHMLGRSLLAPLPARTAYGETHHANDGTRKAFLREGASGRKLIVSFDRARPLVVRGEEWFDLARDPAERQGARPRGAAAEELRRRLVELWEQARRPAAGPPVALTPEQRERLRALGYTGP